MRTKLYIILIVIGLLIVAGGVTLAILNLRSDKNATVQSPVLQKLRESSPNCGEFTLFQTSMVIQEDHTVQISKALLDADIKTYEAVIDLAGSVRMKLSFEDADLTFIVASDERWVYFDEGISIVEFSSSDLAQEYHRLQNMATQSRNGVE